LVGTDVTGTVALQGINQSGVVLFFGAQHNRIGVNPTDADPAAERNIISGNLGPGGHIIDGGTNYNVVAGNYIGTDITGMVAIANQNHGVAITGGSYNIIGGTTTAERNVISGNIYRGIRIRDEISADGGAGPAAAIGNQILGNYIGVDASGMHGLPNGT